MHAARFLPGNPSGCSSESARFAWRLLTSDGMLLDVLVHLRPGRLPLIYVVEALRIPEIVGLARFTAVVEQKLLYVLPIRRAIVVAEDRQSLLLALQPRTE